MRRCDTAHLVSTLGALPMPFCEIMTYGADGMIVRGELYYDQVSMLVQLGHMPPPEG